MIKHIVMWKLKEQALGVSKKENREELKNRLENLKNYIPEIIELEIGFSNAPNETVSDVVLYSRFNHFQDLEKYQKHPEHLKVVEFVKSIIEERRVVDYEV